MPDNFDILNHHVVLSVEGIDRMYLNVYVPWLQSEQGNKSVCEATGQVIAQTRQKLRDEFAEEVHTLKATITGLSGASMRCRKASARNFSSRAVAATRDRWTGDRGSYGRGPGTAFHP